MHFDIFITERDIFFVLAVQHKSQKNIRDAAITRQARVLIILPINHNRSQSNKMKRLEISN
jgi:hypothetical protein